MIRPKRTQWAGLIMLRIATAAARHDARIGRTSLERLADMVPEWPARWPAGAIDKLVALLLEGHRAIPVIEALDRGNAVHLLWECVSGRGAEYRRRLRDGFLQEAAADPQRIHVIDASQSIEEVHQAIQAAAVRTMDG